jgi:hypothetical protein
VFSNAARWRCREQSSHDFAAAGLGEFGRQEDFISPGNDVDLLRQSDPHRTKEIFNAALSETEAQIASRSTPVSYLFGNGHQSC